MVVVSLWFHAISSAGTGAIRDLLYGADIGSPDDDGDADGGGDGDDEADDCCCQLSLLRSTIGYLPV